ncbi:hypothetical protein GCM10027521_43580 [Amycolatopsis cihanbeyliensis]
MLGARAGFVVGLVVLGLSVLGFFLGGHANLLDHVGTGRRLRMSFRAKMHVSQEFHLDSSKIEQDCAVGEGVEPTPGVVPWSAE